MSPAPHASWIARAWRSRISVSAVACTTSVGTAMSGIVSAIAAADDSPDQVESHPRAVITRPSPP